MPKIEVRESVIHGKGVFARQTIERGEFIGRYQGRRTDKLTDHTLWVHYDDHQRGYEGTGRLRYLNHRTPPNSEFDARDLFALRRIRPGEEITFDYGEGWDD